MTNSPVCRAEHINHIGIAVKDIDSTLEFYKTMFGAVSYTHLTLPTNREV